MPRRGLRLAATSLSLFIFSLPAYGQAAPQPRPRGLIRLLEINRIKPSLRSVARQAGPSAEAQLHSLRILPWKSSRSRTGWKSK